MHLSSKYQNLTFHHFTTQQILIDKLLNDVLGIPVNDVLLHGL
jgi:hypothetical protein